MSERVERIERPLPPSDCPSCCLFRCQRPVELSAALTAAAAEEELSRLGLERSHTESEWADHLRERRSTPG